MKPIVMKVGVGVFVVMSALHCIHAHASTVGASHGNHGPSGFGPAGGQSAVGQASNAASVGSASASASGGEGGRYSMVDNYQPWDEASMRQFEKKQWVAYTGE
jgi:hypothetical protein